MERPTRLYASSLLLVGDELAQLGLVLVVELVQVTLLERTGGIHCDDGWQVEGVMELDY